MSTALIDALRNPSLYPHPAGEIRLCETHISWIILSGDYAYKIKKPVDLGFLDFSSLERRKYYCEQELRLNRRLAPGLYLDVVAISGSAAQPQLGGTGEAIEYAVKMRRFDPGKQLDKLLQENLLTSAHIDQLADTIAAFHQQVEQADATTPFGTPAAIWQPVQENFDQIRRRLHETSELARLGHLHAWSQRQFQRLEQTFAARKRDGFVRNCHGDMHLANITLIDDKVTVFDCIEFNDNFRWIDVISEIAFTTMDLIERQRPDLSARLLDRYLQGTGDYAGVMLLRFYQAYRALVRAKVAIIRHNQDGLSDAESKQSLEQFGNYLSLAESFTQTKTPTLYIAHGVSGAGKTTLSQPLLQRYGMIRLRSDVERKRLFGLGAQAKSGGTIYSTDASRQTYLRLRELAQYTLSAAYDTIVDATFLKREQRHLFQTLAEMLSVPFVILHFHAQEALLRKWIDERLARGKDASEATIEVLEHQLETEEPLSPDEAGRIVSIDSGEEDALKELFAALESLSSAHPGG